MNPWIKQTGGKKSATTSENVALNPTRKPPLRDSSPLKTKVSVLYKDSKRTAQ
jgi:hypothetical protein